MHRFQFYDLSFDKRGLPWSHHHVVKHFQCPERFPCARSQPISAHPDSGSHWSAFCCFWLDFSFLEFDINGIIQYVLVRVWFLSLSVMFLRVIQVVRIRSSFLLHVVLHGVDAPQCVNPFTSRWALDCSQLHTMTNKALVNLRVQFFVCVSPSSVNA